MLRQCVLSRFLLGLCSLLPVCASISGQSPALELVPGAPSIDACPGAEVSIALRLLNPGRVPVTGFQVFLRYSASHLEPLRFEAGEIGGNVVWNGPEVDGGGFRPCTGAAPDPWGDLAGEDMVVVLASVFGQAGAEPLASEVADLGRIVFASRGVPSEEGGVSFRPNVDACHVPFDETIKVFGAGGEEVPLGAAPASVSVRLNDGGLPLRSLTCLVTDENVVRLEWVGPPGAGAIDGYRVFRNGEVVSPFLLPFVTSFEDRGAPPGTLRYEVAVLQGDGAVREGCRTACTVERQSLFRRGHVDDNNIMNLTDVVVTLAYLFQGGAIQCLDAADFDDSGDVNLTDALGMLHYLFETDPGAKPIPPPPFAQAGADPTADTLDCSR
jgi:hypothetical protein